MKADFIPKFIEAIIETGKEFHDMWHWEPLYYKGIKVKGYDRRKFYNGLKNLENRGLLGSVSDGRYKFTKEGRKWISRSLLKFHKLKRTRWDHKWRVVIFDIPQELHNKRNIFRARLKSLGFYMIQKSVFVFPYSCEEELSECSNRLGLVDYVDVIIAENLGSREDDIKKFYIL